MSTRKECCRAVVVPLLQHSQKDQYKKTYKRDQQKKTNRRYNTYSSRMLQSSGGAMGWLWLAGSLKLYVSSSEHSFFCRALLQKRPIILRSPLIVATPYRCNTVSEISIKETYKRYLQTDTSKRDPKKETYDRDDTHSQ